MRVSDELLQCGGFIDKGRLPLFLKDCESICSDYERFVSGSGWVEVFSVTSETSVNHSEKVSEVRTKVEQTLKESLGTLYQNLGVHERPLLLQAVCPHISFKDMNASRINVTQGAYSYEKARRGGRNQLVLPRRQHPPLAKRVREYIEENSPPSSEAQVRTRRVWNIIFHIPVNVDDDFEPPQPPSVTPQQ
ncbi:hypothetical protein BLNAU_12484 [Blattamonas nauphoetae]|uniref:Uncharacterized protein n=1 Tax=Blattamonas nauphoetae TaxID=2049346 RepID=A0ABQ9XLA0_9EUKA|nr:hypothetical protein BLNAU_12484 [Blattamonas nauphoetae]